jgi:hypothetical protein
MLAKEGAATSDYPAQVLGATCTKNEEDYVYMKAD